MKGLAESPLATSSDPCWPFQTCKCVRAREKGQGLSLNDSDRGLFSVHLPLAAIPCYEEGHYQEQLSQSWGLIRPYHPPWDHS